MDLELDYQLQGCAYLMICPNELEELGCASHGSWAFALHAHSLGRWEVPKVPLKRHSLDSGTVTVLQLVWALVAFTVFSQGSGRSACCLQVSWERSEEDSYRKTDTTCSCELWRHSYGLNVLEIQKVQGHLGNSKPRKRDLKWMRQHWFQFDLSCFLHSNEPKLLDFPSDSSWLPSEMSQCPEQRSRCLKLNRRFHVKEASKLHSVVHMYAHIQENDWLGHWDAWHH